MPVGTRAFIQKYQDYLQLNEQNQQNGQNEEGLQHPPSNSFLCARPDSLIGRMLYQAKVISQIITYIWLYYDKDGIDEKKYENAKKLSKYFTNQIDSLGKDTDSNAKSLAKIMTATFHDLDESGNLSEEAKLLRAVFPDFEDSTLFKSDGYYVFPIFDPNEVKNNFISFKIDPTIFSGWITDVEPDHPSTLAAVIAYPPRPQLSEATVTKEELQAWLEDRDPMHLKSNNVYIPTCTC